MTDWRALRAASRLAEKITESEQKACSLLVILIYEPLNAGYVLDLRTHLLKLFLLNVKPILSKSI